MSKSIRQEIDALSSDDVNLSIENTYGKPASLRVQIRLRVDLSTLTRVQETAKYLCLPVSVVYQMALTHYQNHIDILRETQSASMVPRDNTGEELPSEEFERMERNGAPTTLETRE